MNVQYKKGVVELCVLALLTREDRYGYDISEFLVGQIDISDGTVYPVLRKLKKEGLLDTYLSEDSGGPPRKYYAITETGRKEFEQAKAEWLAFADRVRGLMEEKDDE